MRKTTKYSIVAAVATAVVVATQPQLIARINGWLGRVPAE